MSRRVSRRAWPFAAALAFACSLNPQPDLPGLSGEAGGSANNQGGTDATLPPGGSLSLGGAQGPGQAEGGAPAESPSAGAGNENAGGAGGAGGTAEEPGGAGGTAEEPGGAAGESSSGAAGAGGGLP